jgi:HAD superfamily hydrolase (TIGR01509 family)
MPVADKPKARSISLKASLKALIFDVDGTLYLSARVKRDMLVQLTLHGILHPLRMGRIVRILRAYRRAQDLLRKDAAKVADLAAAQIGLAAKMSGATNEQVSSAVELWMEEKPLRAVSNSRRKGLVPLLEKAKAEGLRLAVCSDYRPERKLKALGVLDYFDVVVCAQEDAVGCFKPDPRSLEVTLSRLGVASHEAAFVGDRVDVDQKAAAAAGVACFILGRLGRSRAKNGDLTKNWTNVADFEDLLAVLFPV